MRAYPLAGFLSRRYVPPFKHPLPGSMAETIASESPARKLLASLKLVKRWLPLKLSGQSRLLRDSLPSPPARLLWLRNLRSKSLGDSVMELAGRGLLGAYQLDLLTSPATADLYQTDAYFKHVFTEPESVDADRYDFALLDLFNARGVALKAQVCPRLPFAGLQGFFYGMDYHKMLFSCYRVHHLLGYPHSERELLPFLRPRLFVENEPRLLPPGQQLRAAVALGGIDPNRTYRLWPEVFRHLRNLWPREETIPDMVLVGSRNAEAYVGPATSALGPKQTLSFVGKLSLRATVRLMGDCDAFGGPDGGLMHCAVAVGVPGIALFGRCLPQLFLPPHTTMRSLYDPQDVNNISPQSVAESLAEQLRLARVCRPAH